MPRANLYNIRAGAPFAKTLATHIWDIAKDNPESLSAMRVLLPTRRACRILREAFLELRKGQAMILPQMQPLGDIDEEELALSSPFGELALTLPPALSPLKRQILLARLIDAREDFKGGFDQALELAKALGFLMDQIHTENLDMRKLSTLVPEEFADHWQITLKFLEILSKEWPKILEELGAIDSADRRNRLILALSEHWTLSPPVFPVIAAGTTGSIPATRTLLKTISHLKNGQVILPGLDAEIDEESWQALDETHPQYGFKSLLDFIGAARTETKTLGSPAVSPRKTLCREIMRPAETTKEWTQINAKTAAKISSAFKNLELYTCENEQDEAETIALLLRETLTRGGETACVVTPDRTLAARIRQAVSRWDIALDDSAGTPLLNSPLGQFLLRIASTCERDYAPLDLLALIKHPFITGQNTNALDLALRGQKPPKGHEGLITHIQNRKDLDEQIKISAIKAIGEISNALTPLYKLYQNQKYCDFDALLKTHIEIVQNFVGEAALWQGQEGQAASSFFAELLQNAPSMPPIRAQNYAQILSTFLKSVTIRPAFGTHPRLHILGQLEARLIDADLVILASLNEGTWPPDPGADPWMSRPMRKSFGLPAPERSIGLAAHDFTQGLCAPKFALTRSLKLGGAPTVPARWLQRLDAVMQSCGIDKTRALNASRISHWRKIMDEAADFCPVERPETRPPANARPKRLSVTKIEDWLRDPYITYASAILKLKKLDALEAPIDTREKGKVLHKILQDFTLAHPREIPDNAPEILQNLALEVLKSRRQNPADWTLWLARFENIANWFVESERTRRKTHQNISTEEKGEWTLPTPAGKFTLSGIADRIDKDAHGAVIIDYKSGGAYTKNKIIEGEYPQLPLEALMLQNGAFSKTPPATISKLEYWLLNGGNGGGKITSTKFDKNLLQETRNNFQNLLDIFAQNDTPYISLPRPDKAPRFNDYLHLARVQEWSVLDPDADTDTEAA